MRRHHTRGAGASAPPRRTWPREVSSTQLYGIHPPQAAATGVPRAWRKPPEQPSGSSVVTEHLPTGSLEIWDECE